MSKKTITLTEKDATEIADDVERRCRPYVSVSFNRVFDEKWDNTGVEHIVKKFIDHLDDYYPIDYCPDFMTKWIKNEIKAYKKKLVGMEVEVDEEEVLA